MESVIYKKYKEFGLEANIRALPGIDGLKPVERRILISAYQIARNKFVKSARLTGYVMGHYHPHSEAYETVVQLVQRGFLEGQGNWGSIYGIEPLKAAAQRYTEVKMSPWTERLALELVKYVPWHAPEQLDDEPKYLPTMFPFCLFGTKLVTGIGFGYRTLIPKYKLKDLWQRLRYLLGLRRKIIIKPDLDCEVLSSNEECEGLLTTGSGRLTFRGLYDVDVDNYRVVIKSWEPNRRFESILNRALGQELSTMAVGFRDESSGNQTRVVLEVLRTRGKSRIFHDMLEKIEKALTFSVTFQIVVVDNERIRTVSVDEMLLQCFSRYSESKERMIRDLIQRVEDKISETELILKIRPLLRPYLAKSTPIKQIVSEISSKLNENSTRVLELLTKYSVRKLLESHLDVGKLKEERENLNTKLQNLPEEISKDYESILKSTTLETSSKAW